MWRRPDDWTRKVTTEAVREVGWFMILAIMAIGYFYGKK